MVKLLHGLREDNNYENKESLYVDAVYYKGDERVKEIWLFELPDFPHAEIFEKLCEIYD